MDGGHWLPLAVACAGNRELSCERGGEEERRREGGKGRRKINLLAPPVRSTADLGNLSLRRISNPKLSLSGSAGQPVSTEAVSSLLSGSFTQRELARCWCWGDKSFISHLLLSPSLRLSSQPHQHHQQHHLSLAQVFTGGISGALHGCCT